MTDSPRFGVTYVEQNTANGYVRFNEFVQRMNIVCQLAPESIGDSSPPGSPTNGDVYILGSSPTGDWSGFAEHDVVGYFDGWVGFTPDEGMRAYVRDVDDDYRFDGSAWVAEAGAMTGKLAITSITGTYPMVSTDRFIKITGASTFTLTLIAAASFTGRIVHIKQAGTGDVTIDGNGAETIDGAADLHLDAQWESVTLFSDGTQWLVLSFEGA